MQLNMNFRDNKGLVIIFTPMFTRTRQPRDV